MALTQVPDSRYAWTAPDLAQNQGGVITITGVLTKPLAAGTIPNTVTLAVSGTVQTANADLTVENVAPVAAAGTDQQVSIDEVVTLNGSGTDDNGDTPIYGWTQTGGSPTVILSDAAAQSPTFTAPSAATVLTFTLTVTDTGSLTGTDGVVVTVAEAYVLTVDKAGSGEGSVVAKVDNGTVLLPGTLQDLPSGAVVTLTATAVSTSTFINWGGDVTGDTNPITITMDANKSVTATFNANADLAASQQIRATFSGYEIIIVASNLGPQPAPGAVVSDTFPSNLTDITWTCEASGGASCAASGAGQVLTETLISFPAGGVVTYTVTASESSNEIQYNTVTITPPEDIFDPNPDNNSDSAPLSYRLILPIIYKNATP